MLDQHQLDAVFSALADPTRRAIIERLTRGEATVGTLARPLPMALPSVSKHIKVLANAGLVERRVTGREHWLRLTPQGFRSATDWLTHHQQFWAQSMDQLERLVASLEAAEAADAGAADAADAGEVGR
jgi:DNA-binding transcriptional ArsR family regulator